MQIESISNHKLKTLKELELEDAITNWEAKMYLYNLKDGWKSKKKVLKVFYDTRATYFGNKMMTIKALVDNKDIIDVDGLVLPESILAVSNEIRGYTMPYISNTNLILALIKEENNTEKVKKYFKEIGDILNQMQVLRKNNVINNFYLNDIHEGNFIVNKETDKINVVDLDSCRVGDNYPFASKYLATFKQLELMPEKYIQLNQMDGLGTMIPNQNTEYFCYMIMVLNYIYGGKIRELSVSEFFEYLNYLVSLDFPYELTDAFATIYEHKENANIYEYLELIPNNLEYARKKVYKIIK